MDDASGSSGIVDVPYFEMYEQDNEVEYVKSEIEAYLTDRYESRNTPSFDILTWWGNNKSKYPILARVASDVLAMPVSTVASESAFSTGGRVLDSFRSSLSPVTVEAIVCSQNWLKDPIKLDIRESLDEVEVFEALESGNTIIFCFYVG